MVEGTAGLVVTWSEPRWVKVPVTVVVVSAVMVMVWGAGSV